jgi:hypothetical protein
MPDAAPSRADTPYIAVIRGSRHSLRPQRERAVQTRKLASLPPNASLPRTATDAPPIIVLRGRPTRLASAVRIAPSHAPEPAVLTVIRGARPQRLMPYVQPGPLILHIPGR